MTDTPAAYRRLSAVHVNKWDDQLQTAVPGWELKVLWIRTGTVLPIFVPDASYTPDNVDVLVRSAGATEDRMHALGG